MGEPVVSMAGVTEIAQATTSYQEPVNSALHDNSESIPKLVPREPLSITSQIRTHIFYPPTSRDLLLSRLLLLFLSV